MYAKGNQSGKEGALAVHRVVGELLLEPEVPRERVYDFEIVIAVLAGVVEEAKTLSVRQGQKISEESSPER